jgi:ABC-type sugar transport system ATPase subunit
LPEALRVSDRIAVMRNGSLVDFLPAAGATEEIVMALAAGVSGQATNPTVEGIEA